jgi:5-methylcytosine-specific restriction endonuclease McrA
MKKQSYSDLLKDPRWQKKRLEIMSRDKFICKKCGDTKTQLHVHHKEYIKDTDPWDYKNSFLITVCEDCHKAINEVKKECPEIKFDKIKIYKSNHWEVKYCLHLSPEIVLCKFMIIKEILLLGLF